MTFLPIVDRELRVASRKRGTFWMRVVAALVAFVIGTGFLILTLVGMFGAGSASLGKGLFAVLTWLSLGAALSAGLFFTSDCLSEEKREGTLGFLFLTDLRGYDVVLGKLLVTSLRSFYALLAIFPVLAVTLLMGGVAGAQFWKTALALVNALFLSLTAGLFVSAISRESQKAMTATLCLLVFLCAGGPAIDAAFAAVTERQFRPVMTLSSPVHLFAAAGAWGQTRFWPGLLANQGVTWVVLGLTCVLLPRTWQERARKSSTDAGGRMHRWKFGGAERRRALRRKLVDVNPVLWLACRERWQAAVLWVLAILIAGAFVGILFAGAGRSVFWWLWSYLSGAMALLLYLAIASQAGRFFVEAQRSGLTELLLATPLTVNQIVQGQWRALLRMFALPLAICLAVYFAGAAFAQHTTARGFAAATAATPTGMTTNNANSVTNTNSSMVSVTVISGGTVPVGGFSADSVLLALGAAFTGTITIAANLVALCWFGMWMGLTSKNSNLATLKTIVFVQIIPWFAVSFASALIASLLLLPRLMQGVPALAPRLMLWFPLLMSGIATVLYLGKDIVLSIWARRKLHSEFRERAAHGVAPIRFVPPPALRTPAVTPLPDVRAE